MITERPRTYGKLLSENESLRRRLEEAEQRVEAIRNGEALRESEARFRNLLFALPAAVYTTDRDGRITLFNNRAAELWGRRPEKKEMVSGKSAGLCRGITGVVRILPMLSHGWPNGYAICS
jgi:PAS domain-containing protein